MKPHIFHPEAEEEYAEAAANVLAWLEAAEKRDAWSVTDSLYDQIKAELKDGIDQGESIDDYVVIKYIFIIAHRAF